MLQEQEVTGSASPRGGALVVTEGRRILTNGQVLVLPDQTLRQMPDGTVAVEFPPRFGVALEAVPTGGKTERLGLQASAPDLKVILRDVGPELVEVSVRSGSFSISHDPATTSPGIAPSDFVFDFAMADLTADWKSALPAVAEGFVNARVSIGSMFFERKGEIPAFELAGHIVLEQAEAEVEADGVMPAGGWQAVAQDDAGFAPFFSKYFALLNRGMRLRFDMSSGASKMFDDTGGEESQPVTTFDSSQYMLSLDQTGLLFSVEMKGWQMHLGDAPQEGTTNGPTAKIDEMSSMLQIDLPTADKTSPVWLHRQLATNLVLSDDLWQLFDPARSLPQDPMSVLLEANGTWTPDPRLLAEGWIPAAGEAPISGMTLKLTREEVEGLGLRFSGNGELVADFNDRSRYIDDVPVPDGKLAFLTIGANALIGKLDSLGLLAPDEVQGLRFGLMFLGRPVPGQDDHLATDLAFKEGAFFLNGQKIR